MYSVLPTAVPDIKLTLEKLNEIGLGRGRLPIINNGGPMGSPDLLRLVSKDLLEGTMFITAAWGLKGAFFVDAATYLVGIAVVIPLRLRTLHEP